MVGCTRIIFMKELFILKGYWDVQTLLRKRLTIEHAEIQTNTVVRNKLCWTCCVILSFFFLRYDLELSICIYVLLMYSLTCENIQFIFLLFLYEFGMLLLWFLLRFIPLCRMIELLKECTCCSSRMEFHFDSNGLGCLVQYYCS